jgi:DNA invertase Pin-like site-specific DNA recombinase
MKYVTYFRVSTDKQGHNGLGMEAQHRDVELYMEHYAAEGDEVIAEFSEVISGGTAEPEQLMEAVALCKKTGAALLVAKLDRVSRRMSLLARLMEDIQIKVACMPHADNFQLHLYGALAEQERDFISKRTKAAMAAAKARGATFGGLRDKTGERNKARAKTAKSNAEKYRSLLVMGVEQGQTLQQMADALDKVNGEKFYPMKVKRMVERLEITA